MVIFTKQNIDVHSSIYDVKIIISAKSRYFDSLYLNLNQLN